jgi:hypothetical protein
MSFVVITGLIMVVARSVTPHETGVVGLVVPVVTANSTLSNVITVWFITIVNKLYLDGSIFVMRYVKMRGIILVAIQCPFQIPVM